MLIIIRKSYFESFLPWQKLLLFLCFVPNVITDIRLHKAEKIMQLYQTRIRITILLWPFRYFFL